MKENKQRGFEPTTAQSHQAKKEDIINFKNNEVSNYKNISKSKSKIKKDKNECRCSLSDIISHSIDGFLKLEDQINSVQKSLSRNQADTNKILEKMERLERRLIA